MLIMDQFYWEANRDTLLGFQMPVAIVGLRPERYLREPIAYWDHGLMREFCPEADVCVLGDSDEFLMLELRSEDTAADQLSLGWPTPAQIASRMIVFLTPYQREYLKYPLTLHAGELPADVEESRAKLKAYVDEVFAHVPNALPSHRNHPQWLYHLPGFTKSRHDSLSKAARPAHDMRAAARYFDRARPSLVEVGRAGKILPSTARRMRRGHGARYQMGGRGPARSSNPSADQSGRRACNLDASGPRDLARACRTGRALRHHRASRERAMATHASSPKPPIDHADGTKLPG